MERRLMQIEDNIQNSFLRDNTEIKEKLQIQEKRINDQQQRLQIQENIISDQQQRLQIQENKINDQQQRLQIQENIIKNQEEEKNIYKEKQQSTEKRLERLEVLAEEFNKMKKEIEKLKTEKANNLHNMNLIDEKGKPQEISDEKKKFDEKGMHVKNAMNKEEKTNYYGSKSKPS